MMKDNLTDILASCLEAIEQGERTVEDCLALYPAHRETLRPLLDTATALKARADFAPRPGFREASRARLVKRLVPRQPAPTRQPLPRSGQKRVPIFSRKLALSWMLALALVVSLLSAGTVYASAAALPGDMLYPVKLSVENVRLSTVNDAGEVLLATEFLQTRLDEIQALIEANREDDLHLVVEPFSARIATATHSLATVSQGDAERAAQLAPLLEEALSVHTEVLTALLETVPEQAKPAIERAISSSSRGRDVVRGLFESDRPGDGPPEDIPGPPVTPGESSERTPGPPVSRPDVGRPEKTTPPSITPSDDDRPAEVPTPPVTLPEDAPPKDVPGPPEDVPGPPEDVPGGPSGAPGRRP
jgi:hypothetical protein